MDDLLLVRRRQAIGDLTCIFHGFARHNRPRPQYIAQAFALKQFGNQVRYAVLRAGVENREHVGMVQRGHRSRFLLETPHAICIAREGLRQHLDRDLPPQPRVLGAIDFSHPTCANCGGDLVVPQVDARLQRHG